MLKLIENLEELNLCLNDASSLNEIMAIEGMATKVYFSMLSKKSIFDKRSRRPAKDIFNSLLNLTYMLMIHRINLILFSKGLDVSISFLHSIKNNRNSLSLDLVEPFRVRADKFVSTIVNRNEITQKDFSLDSEGGYFLSKSGFCKYIEKYNAHINIEDDAQKLCNSFINAIRSKDVNLIEWTTIFNSI